MFNYEFILCHLVIDLKIKIFILCILLLIKIGLLSLILNVAQKLIHTVITIKLHRVIYPGHVRPHLPNQLQGDEIILSSHSKAPTLEAIPHTHLVT